MTTNYNTHTPFVQQLKNLPAEIREAKKFVPTRDDNPKAPLEPQWQTKLYKLSDVSSQNCGCVLSHKNDPSSGFLDYDHIFDEEGNFVTETAESFYNFVHSVFGVFPDCYCEKSASGRGLHIPFKVSDPNKFESICAAIPLSDTDPTVKLEIFYKSTKNCFVTGICFNCQPNAPVAEDFDDVLLELLRKVPKNYDMPVASANATPYELFSAQEMLNTINPADKARLSDNHWLAVISVCKFIGLDYKIVDEFNRRGADRYDPKAEKARWNSKLKPYPLYVLRGIANKFGYDEKATLKKFRLLHPDFDLAETQMPFSQDELNFYLEGLDTDLANAQRLVRFCGDRIRWIFDLEYWSLYKDGIWKLYSEKNSVILPHATEFSKVLTTAAKEMQRQGADPDKTKRLYSLATTFQTAKYINRISFLIKGCKEIIINRDDLDRHRNLLCCQNCVVDLQTGKRYNHSPTFLVTQKVRANYDPDAQSFTLNKFLADILPDENTRRAVLNYLGYCLTGEISMQCAHFWTGTGSNGKSTLLDLLLYLLADYGTKLPVRAIVESREAEANSATTHLNCLRGARLAVVDEFKPNHRLDEQLFKTLTGDGYITIRQLHHEREVIEMTAKLVLNGNELPQLNNVESAALKRRIKAVEYDQTFSAEKGNLDPDLPRKLRASDACDALLNILVAEAVDWYKTGALLETDAMTRAKTAYLSENDFVEEFIYANCTFANETAKILRKDFEDRLKSAYPFETRADRIRPKDLSVLIQKKMQKHGAEYKKDSHTKSMIFAGVGWLLKSDFDGTPINPDEVPFP